MRAVADGALNAGGTVIGVLPDFLRAKEAAHLGFDRINYRGKHARAKNEDE
jgi:predicted Rossmann-fold nucleotide-binding protein